MKSEAETKLGPAAKHFIDQRIEADQKNNTYQNQVITRFPPEPNGYLHIGHAKSICLNFGMAERYNGRCHLRFDDTNPGKVILEYINAIKEDVTWLGFKWDVLHHAAEYFDKLFEYALELIKQGKAYVCSLSGDEIREYRGTLTTPGKPSPYRERSVEENLDLFMRMHKGEFADGSQVLRAKIDMASGNLNLRDPVMYRILKISHNYTGDKWCIYPLYDYAHCLSDSIENITHSLCTIEFQDHRPLYNWFLEQLLPEPRPQQIEFARLNISYTLTSKRNLKKLVDQKLVSGWDDPRMPTLVGLRRRGFTPNAIRRFCQLIGISKSDSVIDMSLLEECVRDDLNAKALRAMCVLNPLKVTIENLPDDHVEQLTAVNHPQDPELGSRFLPFTKTIYIEQDDFMDDPPKKYKRLSPGKEVRLRYGYIIKCNQVIKDPDSNEIVELKCTYDPDTLGKNPEDRKVKGIIHWVSATQARPCKIRVYDRLFEHENPSSANDWQELVDMLNKDSLSELTNCYIEANLQNPLPETRFQFERLGYFVVDRFDATTDNLIFNRIVGLRDTLAKVKSK